MSEGTGRLAPSLAALLFLFGLTVNAAPIVLPAYVPTQDGGSHYNTGMVLAGLESNSAAFFGQYFERRATPPSNQLASRMVAWAAALGFGRQAERIVWGLIFAAFSAVVVGNLWLLRRDAFAVVLLPLFAGVLVNLGFMNYLIGLICYTQGVFLLHFGLRRSSAGWVAGLVMVSIATYVAHPIAAFALAATAGSLGCGHLIQWRRRTGSSFSLAVPIGCALVCAVLGALAVHDAGPQIVRLFAHATPAAAIAPSPPAAGGEPDNLRERLIFLLGLGYFVSYSPADYLFSAAFAAMIGWLGWSRLRGFRWRLEDAWLAPAATLLVLCLFMPRRFEFFLPERISPCVLIVVVVWLAGATLSRPAARAMLSAGLLLNTGLVLWRLHWSVSIDAVLSEYASVAAAIPDQTSVLSIGTPESYLQPNCRAFRPRTLPCNFRPTMHFVDQLIGDRPVVSLTNYQLLPEAGFFPIGLRPAWSAYADMTVLFERWPPPPPVAAEIVDRAARLIARQPPDVIVTWDDRLATGGPPLLTPQTLRPLLVQYDRVFTSRPLGAAAVYVRSTAASTLDGKSLK